MFEELILSLHQEIETHQVWLKETKKFEALGI